MRRPLTAWLLASLVTGGAAAADSVAGEGTGRPQEPRVTRLSPTGGQRGTEVTVQFAGQRLFEPQGLLLTRPGLQVLEVNADKPERCRLRLRIASDCPLGGHPLRLRTAFGIGNTVVFQVGALPEVHEQNGADGPQVVPLGCTINGRLRSEEIDRYALDLEAGTRVQCEAQGIRLGADPLDLELVVQGPDGAEIARADDTTLGVKDPLLSFVAKGSGRHVVRVQTAYTDGRNAGDYRLHVGSFPRPTGCLPCGGQPGEELEVRLLDGLAPPTDDDPTDDDPAGDDPPGDAETVRVRLPDGDLPDALDNRYRFYPETADGVAPTPILLRIGGPENRTPTIDDRQRAWVELPGSVHGIVARPGEVTRFYFRAKKDSNLEFRCVARELRSPLDPVLILRQADGRYLAYNDDGRGADSVLRYRIKADGDYRIDVRDLLRRGGPDYFFRLECGGTGTGPSVRMVVGRDEEPVVPIARGNRAGAVLQHSGLDPKRDLELFARNLPFGVTARFGPVQRGTNLVPVILTAADDAELGGAQVRFEVQAAGEPEPRPLSYAQYVALVTARNNQPLLGTVARRLPVAVTMPAPFTVEIEQPEVPIVRGAPLALPVRIVRAEGFTAAIRVTALWRTPGLGAGQITIDAKSDRGALPLSASGRAMTGRFPVAVVARASSRGGSVATCSDFVELQVDEPWITARPGKARTEPGTATELRVALTPGRELPGPAQARLIGLPRGVSAEPLTFGADDRELTFALEVAPNAPPGRHRGFLVQLMLAAAAPRSAAGSAADDRSLPRVEHRFGGGELRIDRPVRPAGTGTRER